MESATTQPVQSEETAAIVREYFEAIDAREMGRATALWKPGCIDHLAGIADLVAPHDIIEYFEGLFAAAPDFSIKVQSITAQDDRAAVLWRMAATATGKGKLLGLTPNGRSIDIEGIDLLTVQDGKIVSNLAHTNGLVVARQMGILPEPETGLERAMFAPFNAIAPLLRRVRSRRG